MQEKGISEHPVRVYVGHQQSSEQEYSKQLQLYWAHIEHIVVFDTCASPQVKHCVHTKQGTYES